MAAAGSLRGQHEFTKEQIDAERPKQKQLYEAGFAGITWPKEFGGQGLTGAHELAFTEEAKAYVLPNFGIAGGTTFGVCAQVMLAHASDDFKLPPPAAHPRRRRAVVSVLLRAGGGFRPRGRADARRRATATRGSSTARRCGARGRTSPTTGCASPARTGACPSTAA